MRYSSCDQLPNSNLLRTFRLWTCVFLSVLLFQDMAGANQEKPPAPGDATAEKEPSIEDAMGFESENCWLTAPVNILGKFRKSDLICLKKLAGPGLDVKAVPLSELAAGFKLGEEHVMEGKHSGVWKDLEKHPTIMCNRVPPDWSAFRELEISIFSERITGDVITVGIMSDNPKTPYKDFFIRDFTVDWAGWKKLAIPIAEFKKLGSPSGADKVDGICFFSKNSYRQPNPYTILHLDGMKLNSNLSSSTQASKAAPSVEKFVYRVSAPVPSTPLNHGFPELAQEPAPTAPFSHQYYFQAERTMFKYYPRFHPGYVSFDPGGKAYINSGETIEWTGGDGKWESSDIKNVLVKWAKGKGWEGLFFKWGADSQEQSIRFDNDGDAYLLEQVTAIKGDGNELDPRMRRILLLYSSDQMKTWTVYELPKGHMGGFEKLDGHNKDCLKRPPAIIVTHFSYFSWSDSGAFLIPPAKKANGKLIIPEPVRLFEGALVGSVHSGDGNFMVTSGDDIIILAGWCPAHKPPTEQELSSRPPIPPDHPGLRQKFTRKTHTTIQMLSANGVPAFAFKYNILSGKMSIPVYIGSGGGEMDGHNWPAVTIDGDGYLHALINGHHNPANYVRSLKPLDISSWTDPEYIMVETELPNVSYATLNCDKANTLHAVFRSTKDIYNNHLGYYRKRQGQPWEKERTLVSTFKGMYNVWGQKMTLDSKNDRLFLTYFSLGNMMQYGRDQYEFLVFQLPDREMALCENIGDVRAIWNSGPPPAGDKWPFFRPGPAELTILVSDDHGETWRLALTPDFQLK
ncbi:MAG TPA: hypothetical protein DET40_08185 [Lentisphaeria bacterium]|nr:hypothetical protein [Lentisphaeria bacterium]